MHQLTGLLYHSPTCDLCLLVVLVISFLFISPGAKHSLKLQLPSLGQTCYSWSWPPLMMVSSVKRQTHPLIQRNITDDVSQIHILSMADTASTPFSTSRQTSCEYHQLAQETVYHHILCFLNLNPCCLCYQLVSRKD